MLSRGIVDYVAEELLKTSCLGCVKISPMMSLETSSWVSRKPFLLLIISLNCESNLMCHLRFRSSTHTQELNNWLNVNAGSYRAGPQEKIIFDCFVKSSWKKMVHHCQNKIYLKLHMPESLGQNCPSTSDTPYNFLHFQWLPWLRKSYNI